MVTLDFSNVKSVEDVNKVFAENNSAIKNATAMMDRVKNPDNYCNVCGYDHAKDKGAGKSAHALDMAKRLSKTQKPLTKRKWK